MGTPNNIDPLLGGALAAINLTSPRVLLPLLGIAILLFWVWRRVDRSRMTERIKETAYTVAICAGAYIAIVFVFNFGEFRRWRNVSHLLLLRGGAPLGFEHALGAIVAGGLLLWRLWPRSTGLTESLVFIRGRRLISFEEALARARAWIKPGQTTFFWGMLPVGEKDAVKNFLIVGAPSSGKTASIQLLLQGVVPTIQEGMDKRLLMYDAKSDVIPVLKAMNPRITPLNLNPFHERCVAWDMAKDIQFPEDAAEIAHILVPDRPEEKENKFFVNYPRLLFRNVIVSFLLNSPGQWKFRDVLLALKTPGRIRAVLSRNTVTDSAIENLSDARTRDNIMSSVEELRSRYDTVAAIWDSFRADTSRWISLSAWLRGPGILLLGEATSEGTPVRQLNQMVLQRIAELSDRLPKSSQRRTWFVLDEIADFAQVPGLAVVLRRGREKGAAVVMGFQTWPAVVKAFGEKEARNLESLCGFRSFLGTNDDSTAEWASKSLGTGEWEETRVDHSVSYGRGETTRSQNAKRQRITLPAVLPDELKRIPVGNSEFGFVGYHTSSVVSDTYATHATGEWLDQHLIKPGKHTPEYTLRDNAADRYLRDWTDAECAALGLPPTDEMDSETSLDDDDDDRSDPDSISRKDFKKK